MAEGIPDPPEEGDLAKVRGHRGPGVALNRHVLDSFPQLAARKCSRENRVLGELSPRAAPQRVTTNAAVTSTAVTPFSTIEAFSLSFALP